MTASDDGTACMWDPSDGRPVTTFRGHTRGVRTAVFSPDGKSVLTASDDGIARVWPVNGLAAARKSVPRDMTRPRSARRYSIDRIELLVIRDLLVAGNLDLAISRVRYQLSRPDRDPSSPTTSCSS